MSEEKPVVGVSRQKHAALVRGYHQLKSVRYIRAAQRLSRGTGSFRMHRYVALFQKAVTGTAFEEHWAH